MQFFKKTNIDFLSRRKQFVVLSIVLNFIGLLSPFVLQLRQGIDFAGGTELNYRFASGLHTDDVRGALDKAKIEGSEIKSFGTGGDFLIILPATMVGKSAQERVEQAFTEFLPNNNFAFRGSTTREAKIGSELRMSALLAVFFAVLAITLYIAFRFELTYGIGAAIALIHDVLVTVALVSLAGKLGIVHIEINQGLIAAFLTVIGFSVNDTVIIFDRIRENREKHKGMNIIALMNLSINETLSRTINTVLTVVVVLFTITVFGGPVLQGFTFTMLIGIMTGAYSSIYIATSFVLWYLENVKKQHIEEDFTRLKNATLKAV